mmetsp:Transcript_28974/g.41407  ORF Transcript_28974/g.41407 Transcript_28974/m.41407 type:complete len:189 (-) Transcript_28974:164-730(-)|eukprot:CAMPEP_0201687758 /NCGR_PEP_ID=MMETSP0578-20130828/1673_1 /ASSEMBLY_ACC=CAM_ASM_000663 /TAXON_ID=267565 /ORGANISM="Skeletonema grethea, Strain CCMP 1804" /LENGTH=188 /DNA_ID=CAMNT_0048171933 /DNA_START=106 /DNA_END=672 /DNA_ORIENTATION=+
MARKKIKAVTRALSSTSLKKVATAETCRTEEMSQSTKHEIADDRNPEETNQESSDESPRESMKEVSAADDTKSGSSHQLEGLVNTKGILKNGSGRRRSNSISLQNSLMWSDDDSLTAMSSITRESYSTKYLQSKSVGGKWLDFIESRVIPSPFCRLACGDIDDASQYGPTQIMEWRIPGIGGCDVAID